MKYQHVLAEIYRKPWAILPEKLQAISELIALQAAGEKLTDDQIQQRIGAAKGPMARTAGNVAVIPIYGVISHRMNMMTQVSGGTSTEKLTQAVRQNFSDPSVKAIVFDIDSPGGSVDGVVELANEIYGMRRNGKKMVAVANTMAASAAYWLASACDEVVVTPSGAVGSIGVFCAHEDISKALEAEGVSVTMIQAGKYKTEGNPYQPLSDEARQAMQTQVDAFYGMFVTAVARHRGVSASDVSGGYGEGRMVMAAAAVKMGMADRVETLDQTLARFGVGTTARTTMKTVAQMERELATHQ